MWLRDPEKASVWSNPRGGSLIYSTRPHDTARGCCCISDTAVFRGRAEVPGREFPRVTLGTIFDLFRSSHTKKRTHSQRAAGQTSEKKERKQTNQTSDGRRTGKERKKTR